MRDRVETHQADSTQFLSQIPHTFERPVVHASNEMEQVFSHVVVWRHSFTGECDRREEGGRVGRVGIRLPRGEWFLDDARSRNLVS